MWHAIYRIDSGALVSIGTVEASPLPAGLASLALGESRPTGNWNPLSLTFDAPTADEVILSPQDFMGRFAVAEETAIRARAMTDANMVTFLARVERARTVMLGHPDTIAGINYCKNLGLITAERAAEILHG